MKIKYCLIAASVTLYAMSFVLPTFFITVDGVEHVHFGYEAFVVALTVSLPTPLPFVAWLANPAFGMTFVFDIRRSRYVAAACAASSVCLAIVLCGFKQLEIGYYVWVSSMLCLLVAALLSFRSR